MSGDNMGNAPEPEESMSKIRRDEHGRPFSGPRCEHGVPYGTMWPCKICMQPKPEQGEEMTMEDINLLRRIAIQKDNIDWLWERNVDLQAKLAKAEKKLEEKDGQLHYVSCQLKHKEEMLEGASKTMVKLKDDMREEDKEVKE